MLWHKVQLKKLNKLKLELDSVPDDSLVAALRNVPAIQSVTLLDRL